MPVTFEERGSADHTFVISAFVIKDGWMLGLVRLILMRDRMNRKHIWNAIPGCKTQYLKRKRIRREGFLHIPQPLFTFEASSKDISRRGMTCDDLTVQGK